MEPGGAVPAEERLVYQGEVLVNFQTSRQWVSIKLFAVEAGTGEKPPARPARSLDWRRAYRFTCQPPGSAGRGRGRECRCRADLPRQPAELEGSQTARDRKSV